MILQGVLNLQQLLISSASGIIEYMFLRRVDKLQYITKRTQIVDLNLPKSKLLNKLIDWG